MRDELIMGGTVSRRLGVSHTTVYDLVKRGLLPTQRTAEGAYIFKASDVERLAEQRQQRLVEQTGRPTGPTAA